MPSHLGIAAIGLYEPSRHELKLLNSWFESRGLMGRKFVPHTGIVSRGISFLSEREMALRAIKELQGQTGIELNNCAGIVVSSATLVPKEDLIWRRDCLKAIGRWEDLHRSIGPAIGFSQEVLRGLQWNEQLKDWETLRRLAKSIGITDEQFAILEREQLASFDGLEETVAAIANDIGVPASRARGVNWGCSGYVRAWEILEQEIVPFVRPEREQFFLVLTVGRSSKCTDFAAADTGAIFGDFATATLVTRPNNPSFPPRLLLEYSSTALPATRDLSADAALISDSLFGYERRSNVLTPTPDGGEARVPERVCWTMDGMGVLYAAAPAMTGAVDRATDALRLAPGKIDWLLGHQPGRKVMERAAGGLRERGYRAEIPHDLTATTGNIGCSSIPHALATYWDQIDGLVACPGIGMFAPASPYMSQGCLVFATAPRQRPAMPVLGSTFADGVSIDATIRS